MNYVMLAYNYRYQGNMILFARKGKRDDFSAKFSPEDLNVEKARRVAIAKCWRFDPGARLENTESFSFLR